MTNAQVQTLILEFLGTIGIETHECELPEDTFLPGVAIREGRIAYDSSKLKYPGDLLHEAGHLAVSLPRERNQLHGDLMADAPQKEGEEMAVLFWTFIAARVMQLPLTHVFHEEGYKGQSVEIIQGFEAGSSMGLPLLEWMGMFRRNPEGSVTVLHWLRPEPAEEPQS